ncbi:hypothetical protein DL546_006806 [Coniochaeta pulveracea]|uniref:Uncharacterized protein n=1 Tax=Coniochaeta pulveracea TaxID=177199 RepID=A0A420YCU3_9PEZI|nr:hypothetical protein DL546_006806 [Coniochaeta pulveracea]
MLTALEMKLICWSSKPLLRARPDRELVRLTPDSRQGVKWHHVLKCPGKRKAQSSQQPCLEQATSDPITRIAPVSPAEFCLLQILASIIGIEDDLSQKMVYMESNRNKIPVHLV